MAQRLLGVAEIAAMLGLTRQRVNQLIQSADFPAPEAELSAGRIWARGDVEAWVAAHPDRAVEAGSAMFANFTAPSRAVIVRAQEEARGLRHDYLGTEHLLLAVLSDAAPGVAPRLASLGVEREGIAADIEARCPAGGVAPMGHIPFTPRSKEILTIAAGAAIGPVEPRHIARAVVRVADGIAAQVVRARSHLGQDQLVAELDRLLADGGREALFARASTAERLLRCSFCGKGEAHVQTLVAGPGIYICDECVDLCHRVVAGGPEPVPTSVTARLDVLAAQLDQLRRDVAGRDVGAGT